MRPLRAVCVLLCVFACGPTLVRAGSSVFSSMQCSNVEAQCASHCSRRNRLQRQLRIGLTLPKDSNSFLPALSRVRPWVDRALEAAHLMNLIPRSEFDVCVIEGDTRCSMEHGLITAVDLMGRCCPHVFVGPTCELSLSSVARLVKLWQTPLITVGGLASDYTVDRTSPESEYFLLVRVGWSFRDIAAALVAFMDKHHWRKIMLIYDTFGYAAVSGFQTCYLMMTSLVSLLKQKNMTYSAYDTDKNKQSSIKENLKREMGFTYSTALASEAHKGKLRLDDPLNKKPSPFTFHNRNVNKLNIFINPSLRVFVTIWSTGSS